MRRLRSYLRPSAVLVLSALGLASFVAVAPPAPATTYAATFATWSSATSGSLGGATITITTAGVVHSGAPIARDLATANYSPAGSATQSTVEVDTAAADTITFSTAVTNPAIYLWGFPGPGGTTLGPNSVALSSTGGSCTWSILSGFTDGGSPAASISGSTLTATVAAYLNGIVLCTGTVSAVTLTPSAATPPGAVALTIATLVDTTPTTSSSTTTTTAPSPTSTTTPPTTAPVSSRSADGVAVEPDVAAMAQRPTFTG